MEAFMIHNKSLLLMTRPRVQAESFITDLKKLGVFPNVIYAPLIDIDFFDIEVQNSVQKSFIFTSVNGVLAYCRSHIVANNLAYCVNETTALAAKSAGFRVITGNWTAKSLSQEVCVKNITYIRAQNSAYQLKKSLLERNIFCEEVIGYRQLPKEISNKIRATISNQSVIIPIFSSFGAKVVLDEISKLKFKLVTFLCISDSVCAVVKNNNFKQKIYMAKGTNRKQMLEMLKEIYQRL